LDSEGGEEVGEFEMVPPMRVIESDIAGDVASMEYAPNHHYLKLRDKAGAETVLIEHGLCKYTCDRCDYRFWTETGEANICPRCGSKELTAVWTRPQVALVPEKPSDFKLLPKTLLDDDKTPVK
jgi:RNA polymerase subunit RPABC4/transcription elongation factor Spt4